ncbi:sigma-70 family RNA polymerase sigma factor [Nordella sp. HKS 07]|uniref:sigma-70 family RNA polymerase sigma factor n=1 Tax=Nordella sp. HKS 07 TaxID=2712222 RepID=UPI0013E157B8|nr:sigma-70 family RNA polymerase sigma factor [Nordella sp. HKS 07]QIG50753.1 sigma-70 family RNA polymerase sigma factor [Nordella sp. HKS 07]
MRAQIFETHRKYLTGLAYRMLGSYAEAEDVVQDVYLRWHRTDQREVVEPRAFLTRVTSRLCLDVLKSARRRRETYVGPWLPEPLIEGLVDESSPAEELAGDLSVAMMLALERLSPLERAAFLLHDIFEMGFPAVAETIGRSEESARQLASRARRNLRSGRPRYKVEAAEEGAITRAFHEAASRGDLAGLSKLLGDNVVLQSDGGGNRTAAVKILSGITQVAKFLTGYGLKTFASHGVMPVRFTRINGMPGFATIEADGLPQTMSFEITDGKVTGIYVVRNPEKLKHITAEWIRDDAK